PVPTTAIFTGPGLAGFDDDLGAIRRGRQKLSPEVLARPAALRHHAPEQRKARRTVDEREGRQPDVPRSYRLEPVALQLGFLALAHAEVQREAVEELEELVLLPMLAGSAAELRLLLGHERVDLVLYLFRPGQPERLVEAVALLVDAGSVHRHEQTRLGVLLGDSGN